MLRINPLQPPRPFLPLEEAACLDAGHPMEFAIQPPRPDQPLELASTTPPMDQGMGHGCLISAEDYDPTGILAGVDPCESRYWWMPELHSDRPARGEIVGRHAARRSIARPPAAA